MCAPSPPPAPDYSGFAQQQGTANTASAIQQSKLNNPNVISPFGTQTTTYGPDNQPTLTQTLNPQEQGLLNQTLATKGLLGGVGQQAAASLQGAGIGGPVDFSKISPAPGAPGQIRQDVVNAYMSRANPALNAQWDQKNSDLIAAGLRPGTAAYDRQQVLQGQARNDAENQAILAGTGAAAQDFGQTLAARQQGIGENLQARQTPLNEVNALMAGSQVNNPYATPTYAQNTQVGQTPVFQAGQLAGQYGTDVYNQQVAQANALTSGLFQLGSSAIKAAPFL